MTTATSERDTVCENVSVQMPQADLWDKYINFRPKDVDLTDEDIIEMVREVRYGKV
jgi:hypothetical protein